MKKLKLRQQTEISEPTITPLLNKNKYRKDFPTFLQNEFKRVMESTLNLSVCNISNFIL